MSSTALSDTKSPAIAREFEKRRPPPGVSRPREVARVRFRGFTERVFRRRRTRTVRSGETAEKKEEA